MDQAAYAAEAKIEATHWWFTQRRRLFSSLIREKGIGCDATVVDIGTGTGANLRLLREMGFANVTGIDASAEAARWCADKGLGMVQAGDICALPLADSSVDLVLATDVVEHVDRDETALREIRRVMKPSGIALITVPAFPSLWGLQDVKSHHYRRYRMRPLKQLLGRAGLVADRNFHFNYLLFVPIFFARQAIKLFKVDLDSENEVNNTFLNRLLTAIFHLDVSTAPYIRPPFGVSILVIARRPHDQNNGGGT